MSASSPHEDRESRGAAPRLRRGGRAHRRGRRRADVGGLVVALVLPRATCRSSRRGAHDVEDVVRDLERRAPRWTRANPGRAPARARRCPRMPAELDGAPEHRPGLVIVDVARARPPSSRDLSAWMSATWPHARPSAAASEGRSGRPSGTATQGRRRGGSWRARGRRGRAARRRRGWRWPRRRRCGSSGARAAGCRRRARADRRGSTRTCGSASSAHAAGSARGRDRDRAPPAVDSTSRGRSLFPPASTL